MKVCCGRWTVALILVVGVGLAGCSSDEVEDFTPDIREGFLEACTRPLDDSRLTSAICQCAFDETQAQLSFDEFAEVEEALQADPESTLPPEIAEIVAGCVVEAAEL